MFGGNAPWFLVMIVFEHTFLLALVALAIIGVLLALWMRSGRRDHLWTLLVTSVFLAVLVAASQLIVTPREEISNVCRRLGQLVDEGDVTKISKSLSPDFQAGSLSSDPFVDLLGGALTHTRVDNVRLRRLHVSFETDSRAVATFDAWCNLRTVEGFAAAIPTQWQLELVRAAQGWLVRKIESVPIAPLHMKELDTWMERASGRNPAGF